MLAPVIRMLLYIMLCLMLPACSMECGDPCVKHQDIAGVKNLVYTETHIDSVVMKVNDSITGCGNPRYEMVVGSKTHSVQFPINARIQLFSQGNLWKELFFEMPKNTVLKVYGKRGCSASTSPLSFPNSVELAKKSKRFINSSLTDDYCWLFEKMDDSYDDIRCLELAVSGPQGTLCERW
jgi:hypothetical protein